MYSRVLFFNKYGECNVVYLFIRSRHVARFIYEFERRYIKLSGKILFALINKSTLHACLSADSIRCNNPLMNLIPKGRTAKVTVEN